IGVEATELTAEFNRMVATQITDRIRENYSRIGATLRKVRRTTDVEIKTGNNHLRQANRLIYAVVDVEVHRIDLQIWRKGNVNAIKAQACFIHPLGAKGVRFVKSQDLTF